MGLLGIVGIVALLAGIVFDACANPASQSVLDQDDLLVQQQDELLQQDHSWDQQQNATTGFAACCDDT
jgi:hypothetical protein